MPKIVDPDQLNQATEVVINTGAKTIQLLIAGNLNDAPPGRTSGVTVQAVYSFLKEEWKDDADLNKFRFPMLAIFEAKFELINGWAWADVQTRDLLRDGGWRETTGDEFAAILSLGNMDNSTTDQAYYQNVVGFSESTITFDKTGELNESILINDEGTADYRGFFKVYLREQGKTFNEGNLLVDQDLSALTYQAYRVPLTNGTDLNIAESDANIDTLAPYTGMTLSFLKGVGFTTWANATVYPAEAVVYDGATGRWHFTVVGGTSSGTAVGDDVGVTWQAYVGEVQIGTSYYAYNRIIDGNGGTRFEIYEWMQRELRRSTSINDNLLGGVDQGGYGIVNGNIAVRLGEFVGDTLVTWPGVAITDFDVNSTNAITQSDITVDSGGVDDEDVPVVSTVRVYPFVSAGSILFSQNLVDEPDVDTLYRMYFANAGGNTFDSATAIVVNNNAGTPIQGQITAGTIAFDFDYDSNIQGGRTAGTEANIVVVAQGLAGATWIEAAGTITRTTGIEIRVNAADERNYSNPV